MHTLEHDYSNGSAQRHFSVLQTTESYVGPGNGAKWYTEVCRRCTVVCGWYTEVCRHYRVVYRNVERYAQMTVIMYITSSDCVHIVGIATVRRLCGAMVARLTPDQKVAC